MLILDTKHVHSVKCAEAGCICSSIEESEDGITKEPRVSIGEVGAETRLLSVDLDTPQGMSNNKNKL